MPDKLEIKKVADKPKPSYVVQIDLDSHIQDLIDFLYKQKDRNTVITINGTKVAFTSIIGMRNFARGIKLTMSIIEKYLRQYVDETEKRIHISTAEANHFHSLNDGLKQEIRDLQKQRAVEKQAHEISKLAWKDRIAELEDDRATLKAELDKMRKKR